MQTLINEILNSQFTHQLKGDYACLKADNEVEGLSVTIADDGDAHVFSFLMPEAFDAELKLTFTKSNMNNALFVLTEAIKQDNENGRDINTSLTFDSKTIQSKMNELLKSIESFEMPVGHYNRIQDDTDGDLESQLRLEVKNDSFEVVFRTYDESLRFRTFFGGGKSLRVRNAILFLIYAINKNWYNK